VTPEALVSAGLIKSVKLSVKILGDGVITKSLTVVAHSFSKSAREKIEAAGGKVEELSGAGS
jgi:large subunit ribosomal protein L15